MTTQRLEEIRNKIEAAKQRRSRAEGAMERILEQWKADFGITTAKEAEARLEVLNAAIARDQARLKDLEADLEAVTDWDEA
jgi:hypothetical protein